MSLARIYLTEASSPRNLLPFGKVKKLACGPRPLVHPCEIAESVTIIAAIR